MYIAIRTIFKIPEISEISETDMRVSFTLHTLPCYLRFRFIARSAINGDGAVPRKRYECRTSVKTTCARARTNHSEPEWFYNITNRSEIGCILVERDSVIATSRQSRVRLMTMLA